MPTTKTPPALESVWIETWQGLALDLPEPKPEQIDIRDIAHALACINRFTGHANEPYSVAQHSVLVAQHAGMYDSAVQTYLDINRARWGLLHDAAEAYLGDVSSPLKKLIAHCYEPLEDAVAGAIATKYGVQLDEDTHKAVKHSDLVLLATERRDAKGIRDDGRSWGELPEPMRNRIERWSWRTAEREFLLAFNALFPAHRIWAR